MADLQRDNSDKFLTTESLRNQKTMSAPNADSVSPKVFPTQTTIDVKDIPVSGEGRSVVSPTTPSNVMRKSTVASLLTLRFVLSCFKIRQSILKISTIFNLKCAFSWKDVNYIVPVGKAKKGVFPTRQLLTNVSGKVTNGEGEDLYPCPFFSTH
jgi:hypothetical protein